MTKDNIKGKVVAITGASSGIGKATAELLATYGAKVVLGARRSDRLQEIVDDITRNGGQAACTEIDVTKREDLVKLVDFAKETFGKIDVIINNAGVSQLQNMEDIDVEGWEQMIDVNLKGTLYGIAAALPIFKEQGSGHIINIISTAGIAIVPTMAVYAGTKNAVRTIGEGLRQESQGRWRVTGISPGYVNTDFPSNIKNSEVRKAIEERAAVIAIPPKAIADGVAYAIGQPDNVDVGDIVIRPVVQG